MKRLLLGPLLFLLIQMSHAQSPFIMGGSLDESNVSTSRKIKPGETYTQTFSIKKDQPAYLQVQLRSRLTGGNLVKIGLPLITGTVYGVLKHRSASRPDFNRMPSSAKPFIIGGALASSASFALMPKDKKALIQLKYRDQVGQLIGTESQWVNLRKKTNISLKTDKEGTVEISISGRPKQGLTISRLSMHFNSVTSNDPPPISDRTASDTLYYDTTDSTNTGDPQSSEPNYNEFHPDYGDYGNPFMGGYLTSLFESGNLSYGGYNNGNDVYYYPGGQVNGTNYPSGYYVDPNFTEPGGAGYYPMNNPGPAPISGPGLYPKSRQAEVYQYIWDMQRTTGKEQVVLMTNEGVFIMPYYLNEIKKFKTQGYPGILISDGINGRKQFTYKGVLYHIEGIVHTHPPADMIYTDDGLSPEDINDCANFYNTPIFAITDEGLWRGRPHTSPPGERLTDFYREVFNPTYTFSNLYGYL